MTAPEKKSELTALEVLHQAGDLIEATYWIQGSEYDWSASDATTNVLDVTMDGRGKFIAAPRKNGTTGEVYYQAVVGMCSIGAIAMARTMLSQNEERPLVLVEYSTLEDYDPHTRRAAAALVQGIVETRSEEELPDFSEDPASFIAAWNDGLRVLTDEDKNDSRRQVIAAFRAAEASPLLVATELWRFEEYPALAFVSREEAVKSSVEGLIKEAWDADGAPSEEGSKPVKYWELPQQVVFGTAITYKKESVA